MNDQESIASQWNITTLGELIDKDNGSIQTGPFGTTLKAAEYSKKGIPLISVRELVDGRVKVDQKTPKVNQHTLDRLPQYILQKGDIVFGRKGSVERSALIRDREHGWFLGSDGIRIRLHEYVDMRFIHYQVRSREASTWLLQHASGTTMPSMNQKILRKLPITLPPLPEQKAIASILGSLDNKIELNNKMNETLETMARALYKSWFVDFDPVVAKAAGKRPFGMGDETAALFPDKFVDSELGPIPEGWNQSILGNHFKITMGQSPPGSTYNEDGNGLPFYQGRRDFGRRYPNQRIYCTSPKRIAEKGDTLITVRAPVGDINIAKEKCAIGRGLAAVRHNSGDSSYTYYTLDEMGQDFDIYNGEGTLFGAINKNSFHQLPFLSPPERILNNFIEIITPIDNQIETNHNESQTLSRLRDLLLTKLISGEIRIKDAEKVVEEVL